MTARVTGRSSRCWVNGWFLLVLLALCGVSAAVKQDHEAQDVQLREQISSRPLNGKEVHSTGDFPYVCLLKVVRAFSTPAVCTCVIVSDKVVLAAAHCIAGMHDKVETKVCINSVDMKQQQATCVNVVEAVVPSSYVKPTLGSDLLLMYLDRKITSNSVKTVALGLYEGQTGRTSRGFGVGYGLTSFAPADRKLRKVDFRISYGEQCPFLSKRKSFISVSELICADGNHDGSKGVMCVGDSGGPLIARGKRRRDDIALGVASFVTMQDGLCHPARPTIYQSLSYPDHRKFILDTMRYFKEKVRVPKPRELWEESNEFPRGKVDLKGSNPSKSDDPVKRKRSKREPRRRKRARDDRQMHALKGYVDFLPWHRRGRRCKNVSIEGVTFPRHLQISQEHFLPSLEEDFVTIAWVSKVHRGNLVEICVRADAYVDGFPGYVRVHYIRAPSMREVCGRLERTLWTQHLCRSDIFVGEVEIPQGQACGLSTVLNPHPYRGTAVFSTGFHGRYPIVTHGKVEHDNVYICAMVPRPHPMERRPSVRVPYVLLREGVAIKKSYTFVFLDDYYTPKCVEVFLPVASRKEVLLIGVASRDTDMGFTSWLRRQYPRSYICVGAATKSFHNQVLTSHQRLVVVTYVLIQR